MNWKPILFPLLILTKNNAIIAGLSYFLSISLANYLGPEKFGIYSHALIIAAFISVIVNYGTDQTAPAFYCEIQNIEILFNVTNLIRLGLAVGSFLLLIIVYWGQNQFLLYVMCLMFAIFNLSFLYEIQQCNERYSYIYLFERMMYIGIIFILLNLDIIDLPQLFGVLMVVTLISLFYQFYDSRAYVFKKTKKTKFFVIKYLRENFAIVVVALSTYVYGGFCRLILENRLGSEQLGIYSAGWQIITIGTIFQAQVSRLWRLKLSDSVERKDIKTLRSLIGLYLVFATLPMLLVSIAIFILADKIVGFLFIPAYAELSKVLPIFGVYFLVINLASLIDILWIALRRNTLYMYANLISSLLLLIYLVTFAINMNMQKFAAAVVTGHLLTAILLAFLWLNLFKKRLIHL